MRWVHSTVTPPQGGVPTGSTAEDLYDDTNTLVLRLWPEWTRDGNRHVHWAWELPSPRAKDGHLYDINWGTDPDKETARQQGLAALDKVTKVTVPDSDSNPQHAFGHGRGD